MNQQYTSEWSQIDLARRQMYLPRTKNEDPRDGPLNSTAVFALEQLRKASSGSAVFPNADSPRGWFIAPVKKTGLKAYTWHCNRHTFASRLVMAGVDLHTVGELLGHRTAQRTNRYAHLSLNHKQAAVERISSVPSAIETATGRNRVPRSTRKLL